MGRIELDEYGRKVKDALIPYAILVTVMDTLLKYGWDYTFKELTLATILFTIIYLVGWHELRLRALEK